MRSDFRSQRDRIWNPDSGLLVPGSDEGKKPVKPGCATCRSSLLNLAGAMAIFLVATHEAWTEKTIRRLVLAAASDHPMFCKKYACPDSGERRQNHFRQWAFCKKTTGGRRPLPRSAELPLRAKLRHRKRLAISGAVRVFHYTLATSVAPVTFDVGFPI